MPTIQQLPAATSVDPADEVPVSQAGVTHAISVSTLLSGMQPAILAPTGVLFGRTSFGPGGPEPVAVGVGLQLLSGSLVATGADHATFPIEPSPSGTDQFVLDSSGTPKLLPLTTLQAWLGGTGGGFSFAGLPVTTSLAASDLVAISQSGTNAAISYANLLNGETIDQAAPALATGDTDSLWVSQGSSTLLRQTFSAVWNWVVAKFPTYKPPVVELSTNTTLDGTVHNGRILVCSQPLTLTPVFANMGSGFCCEVLNLSSGNIVFGPGVTTSTSQSVLPPTQMALLRGATYSGGNIVFAGVTAISSGLVTAPGQITGLTSASVTSTSIGLAWSAPSSGGSPTSYSVQYRATGTTSWISASPANGSTSFTLSGLSPSTGYDISVIAGNAAGVGPISAILTVTTAAGLAAPGQVTGVSATAPTTSALTITWSAPSTGGAPSSYTAQFAVSGSGIWSTFATGVAGTTIQVTGLAAGTSYMFRIMAVNAAGSGPPSASVTASTATQSNSVTSITWNLTPTSNYSVGTGAIGVNVHVNPPTAPVQFGLSHSTVVPPTSWVAGGYVNSDLWGAYVPTPASAGVYFVWCEGTDGSAAAVYATSFTVS